MGILLNGLAERAKYVVRKNRVLHQAARIAFWSIHPNARRRNRALLKWRVERALAHRKDVFFVNVGAHNGATGDLIASLVATHPYWKGLLVEPVPHLFAALSDNYPDADRFMLENLAISDHGGQMTFYWLEAAPDGTAPADNSYWDQLGSFSKAHIIKHVGADADSFIKQAPVECAMLTEVLERRGIERVDFLHIDTEGSDRAVLDGFDLVRWSPKVIMFETNHIPESDVTELRAQLTAHGYQLYQSGRDMLALRASE